MGRQCPWWVFMLGVCLPLVGMARSSVPAQDGIKFLRVAREFQHQPFAQVVRSSDQHPLYSYAISRVEPVCSALLGERPQAWTRSAQLVSLVGSLLALLAVFRLGLLLFDRTTALFAALLFLAAPGVVAMGHETLSDSLAMGLFAWTLAFAAQFWQGGSTRAALGAGLCAGLGYWTRPEAIILPVSLVVLVVARVAAEAWSSRLADAARWRVSRPLLLKVTSCLAVFSFVVGGYATVKGELSEKLALRRGAAVSSVHDMKRKVGHVLPAGLDDSRWDFSPKEENGASEPVNATAAIGEIGNRWAGGLGWVMAVTAIVGFTRVRAGGGRWVVAAYVALFVVVLTRHAMGLGYLSDRHVLSLCVASLPWSAAGLLWLSRRVGKARGWSLQSRVRRRVVLASVLVVVAVSLQLKPAHASRVSHVQAAKWLKAHVCEGEAIYDSRGWASFLSGQRSYDAWHIRQALTDWRLTYLVLGEDELAASSERAETLRAIVAYSAELEASFEGRKGDRQGGVLIYRFERPESWEGLAR